MRGYPGVPLTPTSSQGVEEQSSPLPLGTGWGEGGSLRLPGLVEERLDLRLGPLGRLGDRPAAAVERLVVLGLPDLAHLAEIGRVEDVLRLDLALPDHRIVQHRLEVGRDV